MWMDGQTYRVTTLVQVVRFPRRALVGEQLNCSCFYNHSGPANEQINYQIEAYTIIFALYKQFCTIPEGHQN